jgi:hypothetical protein
VRISGHAHCSLTTGMVSTQRGYPIAAINTDGATQVLTRTAL